MSAVWHPFTQHGLGEPIPSVVRAEGAAVWDEGGRRYVDAISSWWVTTHGHCHPPIMAAIEEAARQGADQIIFAGWTHPAAEAVAAALTRLMPANLTRVFFSDSGSTAVEVALKMALGFWSNTGEPRDRIVVMESSYHGDTIGGMSVGARGVFNRAYAPLLFDVDTLPFPEADGENCIAAFEALCRAAPPAALIVEPLVLGAGGMRMYPPAVLRALADACARHGVLLIADEVMTGWGRTGTLLACEQAGVAPDILCLSKGLTGGAVPLAVTMASEPIYAAHLSSDRARMFFHSSSYTANPIACAAARANLELWEAGVVQPRVADLARRQLDRLAALDHPAIQGQRQCGTITAMELGDPHGAYLSALGPRLLAFFRERGLLLRPLGNTVYVLPPYCIGDDDLDAIYAAIAEAAALA